MVDSDKLGLLKQSEVFNLDKIKQLSVEGMESMMEALADGSREGLLQVFEAELAHQQKTVEERSKFFDDMLKMADFNYDKEVERSVAKYEKLLKLAKGNAGLTVEIEKDMQAELEGLRKSAEAVMGEGAVTKLQRLKTQKDLASTIGIETFKDPRSVTAASTEIMKTAGLGLGEGAVGEAGGTLTKLVGSIAAKAGPVGIGIGLLVGAISIWKKIEEHNKEISEATYRMANKAASAEVDRGEYIEVTHELAGLLEMEVKEIRKAFEKVSELMGGKDPMKDYETLFLETKRAEEKFGIGAGDLTKNLRMFLAEGLGPEMVGVTLDMSYNITKQLNEQGSKLLVKESQKAMTDLKSYMYLFGGSMQDVAEIVGIFGESLDKQIFTVNDLINITMAATKMNEDQLGTFVTMGMQLGTLGEMTGDIYQDMWAMQRGGAAMSGETINTMMTMTEELVASMGSTMEENPYLTSKILKEQFGQSLKPLQVEELVKVWRDSGGDMESLAAAFEGIEEKAKGEHEAEMRNYADFLSEIKGVLAGMKTDFSNWIEAIQDNTKVMKNRKTVYGNN